MTEYIRTLRKLVGHQPILQCGASVILINEHGELLLQKNEITAVGVFTAAASN